MSKITKKEFIDKFVKRLALTDIEHNTVNGFKVKEVKVHPGVYFPIMDKTAINSGLDSDINLIGVSVITTLEFFGIQEGRKDLTQVNWIAYPEFKK